MMLIELLGLFLASTGIMSSIQLYDNSTCGTSLIPARRFIKSGQQVESNEFPWSVGILYQPEVGSSKAMCSGTLISKKHVLTAAHCLPSLAPGSSHRLSAYQVLMVGMCATGCAQPERYERGIKRVTLYEHFFATRKYTNDIALIELDSPVLGVHHVCLPTRSFWINEYTDDIIVTGVGRRYDGNDHAKLMKVVLGKRSNIPHPSQYERPRTIGEFVVVSRDRKALCPGDSGGGALSKINGRYVLVGVTARSTCESAPKTAEYAGNYFTDVLYWLPNIQHEIGIQIYYRPAQSGMFKR